MYFVCSPYQPKNADRVEVSLTIDVLREKHFTSYYLSAENDISLAEVKMELKKGSAESNPNSGYSQVNQNPNGQSGFLPSGDPSIHQWGFWFVVGLGFENGIFKK